MRPPEDWRHARVTLGIAATTALAWFVAYGIGLNEALIDAGGFSSLRLRGLDPVIGLIRGLLSPLTAAELP